MYKICHKKYIILLSSITIFCLLSCSHLHEISGAKFNNANYFTEIKAKVYLENNTSISGYLTLQNAPAKFVGSIRLPKEGERISLVLQKIKAYDIEGVYYELKFIEPFTNKQYIYGKPVAKLSFVKTITPTHFNIKLYTGEEEIVKGKSNLPIKVTHYYASFATSSANQTNSLIDVNHPNFINIFNTTIQQLSQNNTLFATKYKEQYTLLNNSFYNTLEKQKVQFLLKIATLYDNNK